MLYLRCEAAGRSFAIESRAILEVLPLVRLQRIAAFAPAFAGTMNYRGTSLMVVDLSVLTDGKPAPAHLSSRIIVAHIAASSPGAPTLVGILVESAKHLVTFDPSDFQDVVDEAASAPFLGGVCAEPDGTLQLLRVDGLLSVVRADGGTHGEER